MTSHHSHAGTSDAEIEAAVRAELPWLLERGQARQTAAAEDTVSGRLRLAVTAMRQPYEQVCQTAAIPFEQLVDFMAGFDRPWWIVGGWSIEAFTGVPREHEDVDLSSWRATSPPSANRSRSKRTRTPIRRPAGTPNWFSTP